MYDLILQYSKYHIIYQVNSLK